MIGSLIIRFNYFYNIETRFIFKLDIFYSFYKAENLDEFKEKKLLAIAGIGNPENFFQLIENNNLKIDWRKVPESDQRIGRFDKVKSKYLPNFALPKN